VAGNLYYNQSSYDSRSGGGYGKSQKTPSFGTGLGSERSMGSSKTGIYDEPSSYDVTDDDQEEFEDETFSDLDDIDKFVTKINMWRPRYDISRRADMGSFAGSGNRYDLAEVDKMPTAISGIAPFSSRKLYPKGLGGAAIGTGGANQAFKTGPYRRTGTQYGSSRAPLPIIDIEDEENEDEFIHYMKLSDLFDDEKNSPVDKNNLRTQKVRIRQIKNFNA
jgi:hypothetical protein